MPKHEPKTFDEALRVAMEIAQGACDDVFAATGERPHTVQRGTSVFVVWPDGEVTNEITVEHLQ